MLAAHPDVMSCPETKYVREVVGDSPGAPSVDRRRTATADCALICGSASNAASRRFVMTAGDTALSHGRSGGLRQFGLGFVVSKHEVACSHG